jgi:NAD(P)H dehydrogenase (quinone)
MANLLILYHSNSGYTKKMAEYVQKGIEEAGPCEIRLLSVEEAKKDDLEWCDGIALGSPTNYGNMAWKMKQWWDEEAIDLWAKIDGKIGCVFTSSGGNAGGGEMCCLSMLNLLINFGFLVFGVTDYVISKQTLHYGAIIPGEPRDKYEIDICKLLGARLYQWCHKK